MKMFTFPDLPSEEFAIWGFICRWAARVGSALKAEPLTWDITGSAKGHKLETWTPASCLKYLQKLWEKQTSSRGGENQPGLKTKFLISCWLLEMRM